MQRAWHFLFAHEPMRHAWWEMVLMRFGVAMVTWSSMKFLPSPLHSQPVPHGLAAWGVDFTWLSDPELCAWFVPFCGVSLLLYIVGVWPVLTLIAPLLAIVGQGVLSNSQGAIHHTSQVIAVALLAGWLAGVWSVVARRSNKPLPGAFNPQQLGLDWMRQILIAGYVVSALMKLIDSGGDWLGNTPYFGLQIEKSTGMAFHANLEPPENAAWLAQYFIDHPLMAKITIGFGLPLELFAFLALLNRRMALFFGLALYAFHTIITEVMHLGFAYNRMLLLFLFINPVWWLVEFARAILRRFSRPRKFDADAAGVP
ncbi:hypothetical protein [Phragmitibacter flavus]|nr:hypothetical protein [Phragmitibacter flavus]